MKSSPSLTIWSRVLMIIGSICLIASLWVPIWRIELDAPQYPEGLALTIHAKGLQGDVDIINGLNHYIGMRTLHNEDFWEFVALPYIIGGFSLAFLLVGLLGKRKGLNVVLFFFIVFGVLAMVDFWKWEYDYGHNLDPNAAIIVPGMAYQPPLIGFKQLLNFGAYSMPDIGGWLFICAGLLAVAAWFLARKQHIRLPNAATALLGFTVIGFSSCSQAPQPLQEGKSACYHCKMTIMNSQFGAVFVSEKGRQFGFDDIICYEHAKAADEKLKQGKLYVADFNSKALIAKDQAYFLKTTALKTPMSSGIVAFTTTADRDAFLQQQGGELFVLNHH